MGKVHEFSENIENFPKTTEVHLNSATSETPLSIKSFEEVQELKIDKIQDWFLFSAMPFCPC